MNPETDAVLSIARHWQAVAVGKKAAGDDEISRFIAWWIAFNALIALQFPDESGDHAQVRAFAKSERAQETHTHALSASNARIPMQSLFCKRRVSITLGKGSSRKSLTQPTSSESWKPCLKCGAISFMVQGAR